MSQHICDQPISNTDATSFLRFRVQYPPAPDSHNQTLRPRLETESREITRPPHRSIGVPDADFRYWLQATEDVSPSGPQGLSGSIPEFFSNQQASVSSIPPALHQHCTSTAPTIVRGVSATRVLDNRFPTGICGQTVSGVLCQLICKRDIAS